jgi:hypothetical protein
MSCASFAFKYYGLAGIRYEDGTLLGPKPENDLPFSSCAPTSQVKNPCVVMFAAEFFKMKTDYEDTKQRLKDLEATCKP